MKVAYDLDGVLSEPVVFKEAKTWRRMTGPERCARREELLRFYARARPLLFPTEAHVVVITARKDTPEVREITERWLRRHLGSYELFMLKAGRTLENVVAFKAEVIEQLGIEEFTEDNRAVVRALRPKVPKCRVWYFRKGERVLDYNWQV